MLRLTSRTWIVIGVALGYFFGMAVPALAHDESIPCTVDMVVYPDKVKLELHFPVNSLLDADLQLDPKLQEKYPKGLTRDVREEFAKSKSDQMSEGLRLTFDGESLVAKVIKVSVEDLVIGVSTEDVDPRPVAVYIMEYTPAKPLPAPKLVTLDYSLLPPPDDGSVRSMVCLVSRKQVDRKAPFPAYVTNDERMSMKCDWSEAPTSQPASKPSQPQSSLLPNEMRFAVDTRRHAEGSPLPATSRSIPFLS